MKSNLSDKILSEKLKGIQPEFDPAAWEKMESMLNEDEKKRRPVFWWWFSGSLLAAVLCGVIATMWLQAPNHDKQKLISDGANTTLSTTYSTNKKPQTQSNSTSANENNNNINRTISGTSTANTYTSGTSEMNVLHYSTSRGNHSRKIANHFAKNVTAISGANNFVLPINNKPALTADYSTPMSALLNDGYALGLEDSSIMEPTLKGRELKKRKKIAVAFSLGAGGELSGSTLAQNTFYNKPTYRIGINADLKFAHRIAIHTAFLFGQTGFVCNNPVSPTFVAAPNKYTSSISEFSIHTGLKGYMFEMPRLKLYASAGFIHHIKLKETFSYKTTPPASLNTTPNITNDVLTYPEFTDFNSSPVASLNGNGNVIASNNTADFSINNGRRYYTSFYAGIGAEYVLQNRWIVFGEPTFYTSLQKAGAQNKNKFNVGLLAGFRYGF